ncbi:MAG: formyltransferase family protein [Evtepia gabavorous]
MCTLPAAQVPGAAPIHWAILNGEQETGATIMHMALALDAGDIIAQRATPLTRTRRWRPSMTGWPVWGRNCWWRRWSIWPTAPPPGPPRRRVR